jgi:aminoglycoside phosphotransferase (APT) family kinase protein
MLAKKRANSIGTPKSEIEIDPNLVYSLLENQHPDLKHLPIDLVDSGWDNVMFRLGDRWAVRLPRRKITAKLIENEQTWLPLLANRFPIAVPTPCRIGKPTRDYPWRWSIVPWLNGTDADREEPTASQAKLFASFLRSLHFPAPENAPINSVRGVALSQRASFVEEGMQRLKTKTNFISQKIEKIWNIALNAPIDLEARWLHGDLHPRNILVENGAIVGIIDWGDLTSGDIATDLASVWMLFSDRKVRDRVLSEYTNVSEATLQRAKGWAVLFGVVLLETGIVDNARNAAIGEKTLRLISGDE